jgi:hypothetical protein
MMRGCEILGRYNSCDSLLRAYVLCCSWSHGHGGPRNLKGFLELGSRLGS